MFNFSQCLEFSFTFLRNENVITVVLETQGKYPTQTLLQDSLHVILIDEVMCGVRRKLLGQPVEIYTQTQHFYVPMLHPVFPPAQISILAMFLCNNLL